MHRFSINLLRDTRKKVPYSPNVMILQWVVNLIHSNSSYVRVDMKGVDDLFIARTQFGDRGEVTLTKTQTRFSLRHANN